MNDTMLTNNDNGNLATDIRRAVQSIKAAILKSQARAAQMINGEQLSLYYGIGRFVSEHSRTGFWEQEPSTTSAVNSSQNCPASRAFRPRTSNS